MPVYVYCCPNRHHTEVYTSYQNRLNSVPCEECGAIADLVLTAPSVQLETASGDFPGATAKWERDYQKRLNQEKKRVE